MYFLFAGLYFYAYYPYRAPAFGSGTVLNLAVAPDQSTNYNYTRSDFMLARTLGVKRSTAKVHLDFYHRLSQIVFELKPGVGFTANSLKIAKVKIVNAITDGTFDLADTMVTAGTTRQDITPCGSWEQKDSVLTGVMAILMPQYINTTTYIEVTVGNRKFSFKPSPAIHLNQTCSRVFTITVNNTGIDVETQIHPWKVCPPVQGDATEDEDDVIVRMTTTKSDVTFSTIKTGDITVDWGDGITETNVFNHTYTDGKVSHEVVFRGSNTVLTRLSCHVNQLTSLEVSKNTALTELNCGYNQLTSLNVSKNRALTELDCQNNQLKSLDVSNNAALTELSCGYNQLTSLEVSNNMALTELICYNNQLTSLEVSKNTALTLLWCADNQLTSLELSKNIALTNLTCFTNQLTSLNVSNNTALTYLSCSDNLLKNLEVSNNTVLKSLACGNNQLTELDVSNNTVLNNLHCSNNPFISDATKLTTIANGLPDWTGKDQGTLYIGNSTAQAGIQSICDAKNWKFESLSQSN